MAKGAAFAMSTVEFAADGKGGQIHMGSTHTGAAAGQKSSDYPHGSSFPEA